MITHLAAGSPDHPVMPAYPLAGAVLAVVANLVADLALTVADPRIWLA